VNRLAEKVLTSDKDKMENLKNPLYLKKLKDKHTQIVNLYLKVLEDLLIQEEKKTKDSETLETLKSDNFHKALIACSMETVFFVNNSSSVTFVKLLELCEVEAFDFWKIIGSFAKFDTQMPYPIKKHLYDLELKILMYLAWKKNSNVHQTIKKQVEALYNEKGRFFNRIFVMFLEYNKENCPPSIQETNESGRSSVSTDGNHDITKSFE